MTLDYTPAIGNLTNGNITSAIVQTFTIPLGNYVWFLAIFVTLMLVYIKTQSVGVTVIIGVLFVTFAHSYLGIVGDSMFYVFMVVCVMVLLFKFWKG